MERAEHDLSPRRTVAFLSGGLLVAAGLMFLLWRAVPQDTIESDVYYYWYYVSQVSEYGFGQILVEYPLPAVLLLWLPTLLVTTFPAYFNLFWITSSLICLAIAVLLAYGLPTRRTGIVAALLWLTLLVASGPLGLFRFDLFPGLLVLLAVLTMARGKGGWSVFIGLATGVKLWPIIVLPFGFTGILSRLRQLIVFCATGFVLVAGSILVSGWDRLISPLTWQGVRGLHVESVLASWILVTRLFAGDRWVAELSDNNSVDFFGPGVAATLTVGTVFQALFFFAWAYLSWRFWRSSTRQISAIALGTTATILLLLVTNKVFSPQYILWLVPVAAATVALCLHVKMDIPRWWVPALIYIAGMTQLAYPTFYGMIFPGVGWQLWVGTFGLVSRNVLIAALAVSVYLRALEQTKVEKLL